MQRISPLLSTIASFLLVATATALTCAPGDVLEYVVTNTATHEGPSAPLVSATHRVTLTCGPRREQWHDVDVRVEAHQSPHGFSKDRHHAALGLGAVVSTSTLLKTHSRSDAWNTAPTESAAALTFHAGIMFNGTVAYVEARHETEHSSHVALKKRDLVLKLLQLLQPEDGADTHALSASADASAARDFFAPGSVGEPTAHAEVESPTAAATSASAADSVVVLHRLASHRPANGPKPTGTTGTTHSHAVRRAGTVARVHKSAKLRFHHSATNSATEGSEEPETTPYLSQDTNAVLVRHTRAHQPMVAISGTRGPDQLRMTYPRIVALHEHSSFGLLLDDVVLSPPRMSEAHSSATAIHVSVSCGEFAAENTAPLAQWQAAFTTTLLESTRRAAVPSACSSITLTAKLMSSDEAVRVEIVIEQPKPSTRSRSESRKAWAASYEPQFQCTPETGRGFPEGTTPRRAFDLLVAEFRGASSLTDDSAFVDAHGVPTSMSLRLASFLDCFPEHTADFSSQLLLRPRANEEPQRTKEMCGWTASVLASMHHPTAAQEVFAKCLDGPCCLQLNDAVTIIARLPAITDLKLVDRAAALSERADVDTNAVAMVLRQWKADKWTKAARFGRLFPKLFAEGGEMDPRRTVSHARLTSDGASTTTIVQSLQQRGMNQQASPAAPYSQFRFSALMEGPHSSSFGHNVRFSETTGSSDYGVSAVVRNRVQATILFGSSGAYEYDLNIEAATADMKLHFMGQSCVIAGGTARYRWHQYRDVSPGDPTGLGPYCPSREYAPNVTAPLQEGQNQNYDMREEWGLFKPWMIATRGPETVSEVPASDGVIQERTDTSCVAAFDLETAKTQHPETFSHDTFDGLPNGALPPPVLRCLARVRLAYGSCESDRRQYALQLMNCLEIAMNDLVAPILHLDRGQELLDSLAGFFGTTMRWRIASGRNSSEPCKMYKDCLAAAKGQCRRFQEECFWAQVRLKRSNVWNSQFAQALTISRSFACPADSASCRRASYCTRSPKECMQNLWDSMVKPFMPTDHSECASLTAQKLLAIGAAQFVMAHLKEMGFMLVYEHELVAEERCKCVKRSPLSTYLAQDDGYTSHFSALSPEKSKALRDGAKPTDAGPGSGPICKNEEETTGYQIPLPQIPIGLHYYTRQTLSIHLAKSEASASRVGGATPEVSTSISSEFAVSARFDTGYGVQVEGGKKSAPTSLSVVLRTDAKPIRGSVAVTTRIGLIKNQQVRGDSQYRPKVRLAGFRKSVLVSGCVFSYCVDQNLDTKSSSGPAFAKFRTFWSERRDRPGMTIRGFGYLNAPVWTPRVRSDLGFVGGQPFVVCNAHQTTGCPPTFAFLNFERGDRTVRSRTQTASRNIGWLSPNVAAGTKVTCEHVVRSCESLQGRRYTNTAVYDPQGPNTTITRGSTAGVDDANTTATPERRCFTVRATAMGPAPVSDIALFLRIPKVDTQVGFARLSTQAAASPSGATHCFYASLPSLYAYAVATTAAGAITRVASKSFIVDVTPLALKQYTIGCGGDAVTLPAGGQASFIWAKTNPVCVSFLVTVPESGISKSVVFVEDSDGARSASSELTITNDGVATGSVTVAKDGRYRFVFVVTKRKDGLSVDLPTAFFGLDTQGPAKADVWFINKATGRRVVPIGPTEEVCLAWPAGGFYDASGTASITATVTCAGSGSSASASLPAGDIGTVNRLCFGTIAGIIDGERCTGNVTATDAPGLATSSTVLAVNDVTAPIVDAFMVNCGANAKLYNATTGRPVQISSSRTACFTVTAHDPETPVVTYEVRILSDSGSELTMSAGTFGSGRNSTNVSLTHTFDRDKNFTATLTVRNLGGKVSAPISVLFSVNPASPKLPDEEMPTIGPDAHNRGLEVTWPAFACNPCPTKEKIECTGADLQLGVSRVVRVVEKPSKSAHFAKGLNVTCFFSRVEPSGEVLAREMPKYGESQTIAARNRYTDHNGNYMMTNLAELGLSPRQDSLTCWYIFDTASDFEKNITVTYDDFALRMRSRWFETKRVTGGSSSCKTDYSCSASMRCANDATGEVVLIGEGSYPGTPPGWAYDESDRIVNFTANGGDSFSTYLIKLTWAVNNLTALADDKINDATIELKRGTTNTAVPTPVRTWTVTPTQLRSGAYTLTIDPAEVSTGTTEFQVFVNYTTKAADPAGAGLRILHTTTPFTFLHPLWTPVYSTRFSACEKTLPWENVPAREHLRVDLETGPSGLGMMQIVDSQTGANITELMTGISSSFAHTQIELPIGPWSRYEMKSWIPTANFGVAMATRPLMDVDASRFSFQAMLVAFDGLRELTHSFSKTALKAGQTTRLTLDAPKMLARGGNSKVTVQFDCNGVEASVLLRRNDGTVTSTSTYWDVDLLAQAPELRHILGNATNGLVQCTTTCRVEAELSNVKGLCLNNNDVIESSPALVHLADDSAIISATSISGCESAVVTGGQACMTLHVATPLPELQVTVELRSASKQVSLATLRANGGEMCLDVSGQHTASYEFSAIAASYGIVTSTWTCKNYKVTLTSIDTAMFVAPFGGSPTNPALPASASAVTSADATAQMMSDQNVWSGTSEVCLGLPRYMLLQPRESELLVTGQAHVRAKGDTTALPAVPTDAASMPVIASLNGGGLQGSPLGLPFATTVAQHFCVPLGDVLSLLTNGSSIYVDVGLQLPTTNVKSVARVRATFVSPNDFTPDFRGIAGSVAGGTVGPAPTDRPMVAIDVDVNDGQSTAVCFAHRYPQRRGQVVQLRMSATSSWFQIPQVGAVSAGADPERAMEADPWVQFKVPQTAATAAGCVSVVVPANVQPQTIEQRVVRHGAASVASPLTLYLDNSRLFTFELEAKQTFLFTPDDDVSRKCETFTVWKKPEMEPRRLNTAPPHSVVGLLRFATSDGTVVPLQHVSVAVSPVYFRGNWAENTVLCFNLTAAQEFVAANRSVFGGNAGVAAVILSVFAVSNTGGLGVFSSSAPYIVYALPTVGAVVSIPSSETTMFALNVSQRLPKDLSALNPDLEIPAQASSQSTLKVQSHNENALHRDVSALNADDVNSIVNDEATRPSRRTMRSLGVQPASDAGRPATHYLASTGESISVKLDWRFGISNFTSCLATVGSPTDCDLAANVSHRLRPDATEMLLLFGSFPTAAVSGLAMHTPYVMQYGYNIDGGYRVDVKDVVFVLTDKDDPPTPPRLGSIAVAVATTASTACPDPRSTFEPAAAISTAEQLRICFEESVLRTEVQVPVASYRVTLKPRPDLSYVNAFGIVVVPASNGDFPEVLNTTLDVKPLVLRNLAHNTPLWVCIEAKGYDDKTGPQVCRSIVFVSTLPPAPAPLDGMDSCVDRTLSAQKSYVAVNWCGADTSRNWTAFGVSHFTARCQVTRAAAGVAAHTTSNVTVDTAAQGSAWAVALNDGDSVRCTVCAMSPLGGVCATTNGVTIAAVGDAGEVIYPSIDPPTAPSSVAICTDTTAGAASCRRLVAHNAGSIKMIWTACAAPAAMSIDLYRVCVLGSLMEDEQSLPLAPAWCGSFSNTTLTATISDAAAVAVLSKAKSTKLFASVMCNTSAGIAVEMSTEALIVRGAPPTPTLPTAALAAAAGSTCVAVNASSEATIDGGQCSMCGATPAAQIATHLRFTTAPSNVIALVEGRSGAPATAAQLKAAFLALQNTTSISALDAWLEGSPILNIFVPRGSTIDFKDTTVTPTVVTGAVALCCADVSAAPCSVTAGGSDAASTIQASVSSAGLSSATASPSVRIAGSDAVGPARDTAASTATSVHGLKVTDTALTVCAPAHAPRTAANAVGDGVVYHVWARGEGDDALNVELALPAMSTVVAAAESRTSSTGCVSWPMNADVQTSIDGKNITFHARVVDLATGGRLESAAAIASLRALVSTSGPRIGLVTAAVASRTTSNVQCSASVTALTQPHSVSFKHAPAVAGPSQIVPGSDGYSRYEYDAVIAGTTIASLLPSNVSSSEFSCAFEVQPLEGDVGSAIVSAQSEPTLWTVPTSSLSFALRESANVTAPMRSWVWANKTIGADVTASTSASMVAVESSLVAASVASVSEFVTAEVLPCSDRSLAAQAPAYGAVNAPPETPGRCTLSITPQFAASTPSSTIPTDGHTPTFDLAWSVADADSNAVFPGASSSQTITVWDVVSVSVALTTTAGAVGSTGAITATLKSSTGAAVVVDDSTTLAVSCTVGCTVSGDATKTATRGEASFGFTLTAENATLSVVGSRVDSTSEPAVDVASTIKVGAGSPTTTPSPTPAPTASSGSGSSGSGGAGSGGATTPSPASSAGTGATPSPPTPASSGATPSPLTSSSGSSSGSNTVGATPAPVSAATPAPDASPDTPAPTPFVDDQPPMLVITRASAATEVSAVAGHVHHLPVRVQYRNNTALVVPDVTAMSLVGTIAGQNLNTCVNATIVRYAPQDPTASTSAAGGSTMDTTDAALLSIRFTAGSTSGTCGFTLSGPIPGNASWNGAVSVSVTPKTIRCAFTHKVHIPGQPAAVQCLEEVAASASAFIESGARRMNAAATTSTTQKKLSTAHCPIIGRCSGVACGAPLTATTAAGNACGLHSIAEVNTNAASGSGTTGDVEIFSAHLPGLRLDNYSASSSSLRLTVNASVATNDTTVIVTSASSNGGVFDRRSFIEATAKKLGVAPSQVLIASLTPASGGASSGQYSVGVVVLRDDEQTPVAAPEASASLSNGCVKVVGTTLPSRCIAKTEDNSSSKTRLAIGLGIGIPLLLLAIAAVIGAAVWWFVLRGGDNENGSKSGDESNADSPKSDFDDEKETSGKDKAQEKVAVEKDDLSQGGAKSASPNDILFSPPTDPALSAEVQSANT